LRGGVDVVLRIEGNNAPYHTTAVENNPEEVRKWLQYYLGLFPQDAAYHDIRVARDKSLVEEDLEMASRNAIVVEANPIVS